MIGQEHVTGPLMQALRSNRVNHAYLFSGPRGCGKTTSARVLARILNCAENSPENPRDTPCGQCPSCQELARGGAGSLDVVEIDAASHGGVDDARELRERATFSPSRDRYKIFILDEAHMVTAQGFNALLKIVEEPPPYLKFIFATTEPDKVIGTIRSRTHHYPFKLVAPDTMLSYISQLCGQEGIAAGEGVLPLVVRAGGGSVRDTLSVLDQLIAGAQGSAISYEHAVALLGYTPATLLDDVVDALAAHDGAALFRVIEEIINTGHEPRRFVEDLLERFRDLLIVALSPDGARAVLSALPADQYERMNHQAQQLGAGHLTYAADTTNTALTEMSGATSPRLHLELLCARLLLPTASDSAAALAARIDKLERGHGPTRAAVQPTSPAADGRDNDEAPVTRTARPVAKRPDSTRTTPARPNPAPAQPAGTSAPASNPAPEPASQVAAPVNSPTAPPAVSSAASAAAPTATTSDDVALAAAASWAAAASLVQDSAPSTPQRAHENNPRNEPQREQQPEQPVASDPAPGAHPVPTAGVEHNASGASLTKGAVESAWVSALDTVRQQSMPAWAMAQQHAAVHGVTGSTVHVTFPSPGLAAGFAGRGGDALLAQALSTAVGAPVEVAVHVAGSEPAITSAPPLLAAPDVPMHRTAPPQGPPMQQVPQHVADTPTPPEATPKTWGNDEPPTPEEPPTPDEPSAPEEPPTPEVEPLPTNMFGAAAAALRGSSARMHNPVPVSEALAGATPTRTEVAAQSALTPEVPVTPLSVDTPSQSTSASTTTVPTPPDASTPPWEESPRQAAERRAREEQQRLAAQPTPTYVDDEPAPDDEDLEASALFGVPLLMKRLGATIIDEQTDNGV